jgi:hypothetical protein
MLQWGCSSVRAALQWCYSGVTGVFLWCYSGVIHTLRSTPALSCSNSPKWIVFFVTLFAHCCFTVVSSLLHCCHTFVTMVLHCYYTIVTLLSLEYKLRHLTCMVKCATLIQTSQKPNATSTFRNQNTNLRMDILVAYQARG